MLNTIEVQRKVAMQFCSIKYTSTSSISFYHLQNRPTLWKLEQEIVVYKEK